MRLLVIGGGCASYKLEEQGVRTSSFYEITNETLNDDHKVLYCYTRAGDTGLTVYLGDEVPPDYQISSRASKGWAVLGLCVPTLAAAAVEVAARSEGCD